MGDWKVVILEIVLRIRGFTLPAYWTDQVLDKVLTDLMEKEKTSRRPGKDDLCCNGKIGKIMDRGELR